jgi:hypothetical protein
MNQAAELKAQIKKTLVENLMLQIGPEQIGDEQPLFGPEGLGLDSVDALQLVAGQGMCPSWMNIATPLATTAERAKLK